MQRTLLAIIVLLVIGGGVYYYTQPAAPDSQGASSASTDSSAAMGDTMPAGSDTTTMGPADEPAASTAITAAVVAQHKTQADCWTIISGKVYDVTTVIASHPGGPDKIIAVCGTDGTSEFQEMNKFAQGNAMKQLASLYKGDLAQ